MGEQSGKAPGRAPHVMRVHEVRSGERAAEAERQRVCRMAPEESQRAEDADAEPARLSPCGRRRPEGDEAALDMAGERTRELERVPLATPEDAPRPEERRSDVDDAHLLLPLLTLGDPRRLTGGYLYHLRMAEAAPSHGCRIVFLSFPERPFPLAARHASALLGRARSVGASAVLVDSIAAALAVPALARHAVDVPVVGVLHQPPGGIDHGRLRTAVQAALDRRAWANARLLVVASDHLAEQLVRARIPPALIRVVPPGRDVATPGESAPLDLRRDRRAAFLCVANWLERKGVLELLDAFARLPPDAATLHLAGDCDVEPRYAARVRRRLSKGDVAGRVVVHGRLSREDVAGLYRAADAFVLPAIREPYGTVYGEAMAFGLPVVGWRAGNLPYLAEDGREGLLVEPGDAGALTRALHLLAVDDELRARLGEGARRRALVRPTWTDSACVFFAAIRGLVEQERRVPGSRR